MQQPLERPNLALRLAVVGAGALGSEVCRRLAELHPSGLLVLDPDVLEARNLPLSPLFRSAVEQGEIAGQPKADVVARYAARCGSPGWMPRIVEIADLGLAELREVDLLISCTDSALARAETCLAARTLRIPMLDGAVRSEGIDEGRITCFAAGDEQACYLCGLSENRRAEILAYALSASLGCAAMPESVPMSGTSAAAGAVAAALIERVLRFAAAGASGLMARSFAQTIEVAADGSVAALEINLSRSSGCPWHELPDPAELIEVDASETLAAALLRHREPGAVLEFPWPVCLSARCRLCGGASEPLRRTASVRRKAVCRGCFAIGSLEPLRTAGSVTAGDALASNRAQELGLPPRQLYRVRRSVVVQ